MEEETKEIAWYVTIHLNGISRTYNFRSKKERDTLYGNLIDRALRNQAVEINDCKEKENIFIPTRSVIIKGETYSKLDIEGLDDLKFHKKDDIILTVLGARV